jgi:soluble lytic murein transglycosylase-like protein
VAGLSFALKAVLLLVGAAPAAGSPVDRWASQIREASRRFEIPSEWIASVISVESGGLTMLEGKPITSPAGAMGLMQLMPQTWLEMRHAFRLGDDPYQPGDNILAGTAYLRSMYDRFGYPGLFAAYNAGPSRYEDSLSSGRALPAETRAYVSKILERSQLSVRTRKKREGRTHVSSKPARGPVSSPLEPETADSLFAIRR